MKTLGIIGGLGAQTTSNFYQNVIYGCQHINHIHRPPILMWSVPISYQAEEQEIIEGIYIKGYERWLIDAAKKLQDGGADFIAMPCNSACTFIEEIQAAVEIPVINIIEETINHLKQDNIQTVGIISSLITQKNALYDKYFMKYGIDFTIPTKSNQLHLDLIIANLTNNKNSHRAKIQLEKIINDFTGNQIHHIVLACAALSPLLSSTLSHSTFYDTLKIYAHAAIKKIIE